MREPVPPGRTRSVRESRGPATRPTSRRAGPPRAPADRGGGRTGTDGAGLSSRGRAADPVPSASDEGEGPEEEANPPRSCPLPHQRPTKDVEGRQGRHRRGSSLNVLLADGRLAGSRRRCLRCHRCRAGRHAPTPLGRRCRPSPASVPDSSAACGSHSPTATRVKRRCPWPGPSGLRRRRDRDTHRAARRCVGRRSSGGSGPGGAGYVAPPGRAPPSTGPEAREGIRTPWGTRQGLGGRQVHPTIRRAKASEPRTD